MIPIIHTFKTKKDFTQTATKSIEKSITEAIEAKGQVRLALSGGNSPKPVYQALSHSKKINWSKVDIYLVDERYVPETSKESNTKMIRETLIDQIPGANFYPFETSFPIGEAVEKYEKRLRSIQKTPLFDLVILGLGADGHTASLFPGIPELDEEKKWVAATKAKGYPTENRLTLTFPAILNSNRLSFLIQGDKDEVIQKWLEKEIHFHQLPSKKILEHNSLDVFYFKGK